MKLFPVFFALLLCPLFLTANPTDSLAEVMVARAERFIGVANFDSANIIGHELLAYARQNALPPYQASAWSILGIVAYNNNRAAEALTNFDSALSIRRRHFGNDHEEVLRSLSNTAAVLTDLLGDTDAALERLKEAEQICKTRKEGCRELLLGLLYNNLGNIQSDRGNYELAEQYYQKSYAIRSKYPNDPSYKLASLLNNLGSLEIERGNLAAAGDYLLRSEALYLQWNDVKPTIDLIGIWQNLGTIANFEHRFADAKALFRRAMKVGKVQADDLYFEFGALNYNLGASLFAEDSLDAAEKHYRAAINFWETNFGFHPDQTAALLGLALINAKNGQVEAAIARFSEAEKLDEANFPPQHPRRANTYKTIGNFYHNQGDPTLARAYYLKQIKTLGMEEPSAAYLAAAQPSYLLLAGLTDLGKLHYDAYRNTRDTLQLDAALLIFALGDSIMDRLREIRLTFAEQKELLRDARRLAEWAMQAEIARFGIHSTRIFERSEQTRAFSLFGKFREDAAIRFAGVPDSLTAQYRSIQYEIARTDELFRAMPSTDADYFPTQAHLAGLRAGLAGIKTKLSRFEQYYKFRFGTPTASLQDIQQKILRPEELMIQYFVGDSALFIFTIGKERYDTHVIPLDFQLDLKVKAMWQGITAYYTSEKQDSALWESSLNAYEQNAIELYNRLVLPLQLNLADSNIIIVPDGILWLIPFDALLTRQPEERGAFNSYPYLLNLKRTSFAYSATLLREATERTPIPFTTKPLFACAPFDQSYPLDNPSIRRKFGQLPESGLEVREAQRLLGGSILLGPEATKSAFLSRISQYRILLFSTHGQAGNEGFVAFYPEKGKVLDQNLLFMPEIYNVGINADLVIFSACETALGKSEPGEGLVSMARAFSYAGARGLVTTLWSVNDYSNSRITIALCSHLQKGQSAFKALSNAKLDWLKSASSESAHPWFWAGVIGFGVLR
jgi:CHAT domain-containing protein